MTDLEFVDDLWEGRSYAFRWTPPKEDDDLLDVEQIILNSLRSEEKV